MFIDKETCIGCGYCESQCPFECIHYEDTRIYIDETECCDCGACVDSCMLDSIKQRGTS